MCDIAGVIGLFVGLLFGVFAQQSRFCLRAGFTDWLVDNPKGIYGKLAS